MQDEKKLGYRRKIPKKKKKKKENHTHSGIPALLAKSIDEQDKQGQLMHMFCVAFLRSAKASAINIPLVFFSSFM